MSAPEARARDLIDRQLQAAGWVLQDRDELNRTGARGVAVREFPLPAGEADYLLFEVSWRECEGGCASHRDAAEQLGCRGS